MDTLHEVAETLKTSFDAERKRFRKYGCAAIIEGWEGREATEPTCEQTSKGRSLAALMDLAGDDLDGYASDVEDFEAAGLL
jgi:hypothetical protein